MQESLEEALHHFREAVRVNPSNARARYYLAVALANKKSLRLQFKDSARSCNRPLIWRRRTRRFPACRRCRGKKEEALQHSAEAQRLMKLQGSAPPKP